MEPFSVALTSLDCFEPWNDLVHTKGLEQCLEIAYIVGSISVVFLGGGTKLVSERPGSQDKKGTGVSTGSLFRRSRSISQERETLLTHDSKNRLLQGTLQRRVLGLIIEPWTKVKAIENDIFLCFLFLYRPSVGAEGTSLKCSLEKAIVIESALWVN